jgi:LysR family cyn operon transcriptional activator
MLLPRGMLSLTKDHSNTGKENAMELRHLRYFVRAAELLHFTQAAESLYISQSTLSRDIQQLEHEIGLPLFKRLGRNVQLTDAGSTFLHHALSALREIETAREKIANLSGVVSGTLQLGALLTFGRKVLPAWICAINQAYPQIKIVLKTGTSDFIEQHLQSGSIDLGLSFVPPTAANLSHEVLYNEELFLVVGKDHELASRDEVDLETLQGLSFAAVSQQWSARRIADSFLAEHGIEYRVTVEIDDLYALLKIIAQNKVCGLLPQLVVSDYQDVCLIPIKGKPLFIKYGVLWTSDATVRPAAQAFLQFLRTTVLPTIKPTEVS